MITYIWLSQKLLNLQNWWKVYESRILLLNMISHDLNHHCIQFHRDQNWYVELSQISILRHFYLMISYLRKNHKTYWIIWKMYTRIWNSSYHEAECLDYAVHPARSCCVLLPQGPINKRNIYRWQKIKM